MVRSFAAFANNGNKTEPYGPGAKGSVVLTNGRVLLVITRADVPKFASNNRTTGTPEENKAAVAGSIAYFGLLAQIGCSPKWARWKLRAEMSRAHHQTGRRPEVTTLTRKTLRPKIELRLGFQGIRETSALGPAQPGRGDWHTGPIIKSSGRE